MTKDQFADIESRANAATPGPWNAIQLAGEHGHEYESPAWYCYSNHWEFHTPTKSTYWSKADAELMAHAREDIPALIAVIREQESQLKELLDDLRAARIAP